MALARFLFWLFAALGLAALGAAPAPAHAAGVTGTPVPLCFKRVTPQLAPAAAMVSADGFDCTTPQRALGPGSFYARSAPLDLAAGQEHRARTASLWLDRLTLHILYADGRLVSIAADNRQISRHIQLGAIIEFRIPARPAAPVRIMWEATDSPNLRGIVLGSTVASAEESAASNLGLAALYGAFAGLCIALIVYNFALWVALRYPFQLAYCFMATTLLLYAFSSSGALAWAIDGIANNDRLRINHALLALAGAGGLAFARTFLEPRVLAGWAGRMNGIAILAVAGIGIACGLFEPYAPRFWDAAYSLIFMGGLLTLFPLLWRAIRMRSNFAILFALAWSAPIVTAFLRGLANFGTIPWNFWIDNSTILALAVEALLSSVAIAGRLRAVSRERDEAREGETIARRLADTDPLTGLLNRRAFLEHAIGRAERQQLLVADLDHFKLVNETLGHDGGDEVLRVFARVLRQSGGDHMLVARIGGEEFAVLTPADQPVDPDAILARLRATRMPFDIAVTASIGSCIGPVATEIDWKKLYRGADAALFAAKSAGRDRARAGAFGIAA